MNIYSVTAEEFKNLCKAGQGAATCRYITAGPGGFQCAKHTNLHRTIDARVAERTMVATSDLCPGKGANR